VSSEFKPPLVVQQFVEHGGVLFKVTMRWWWWWQWGRVLLLAVKAEGRPRGRRCCV